MASLTFNVPDGLVPRIVAALVHRYPDLAGTNAQIAKAGVRRLIAECMAEAEGQAAQVAQMDVLTSAVTSARGQALTDAEAIT